MTVGTQILHKKYNFMLLTNVFIISLFLKRVLTGNNISEINNDTVEGLQYRAKKM